MTQLLSVQRIVGDGYHNAFTDLIRWRSHYYLAFRQAESHGFPPNGVVIVMRSGDLATWETCGRISTGGDDRDPKFVDTGDRLAVVFGTWYRRWADRSIPNTPNDLVSHVVFSRDGTCWSAPRQMYGVNYWLWRVLPTTDGYLCAAYHFAVRSDRLMRSVHLLRSEDLLDWHLVSFMREGGGPGEPVLYQPEPESLHCVLRSVEPDNHSWLGQSQPPYTSWTWTELGAMIHAPVVLDIDGRWIVAGRSQPRDLPPEVAQGKTGARTSVWTIDGNQARHELTVPSAGDCSYCGFAHGPEGDVLMSYYSQHERLPLPDGQPTPADVFLARFTT